MKKIILSITVLFALLVLSGCGSTINNSNSTNTPTKTETNKISTSSDSTQTSASASTVNIQNFAFNPATLSIKKGSTVTWTNNDSVPHQIKSATFNSGQLSNGQSFSFTFNGVGTFDYSCAIHPSMLGKIIVE